MSSISKSLDSDYITLSNHENQESKGNHADSKEESQEGEYSKTQIL